MAPPNTTIPRVEAIHAALVDAGWAGKKISRTDFDTVLAMHIPGTGTWTISRYVETGRIMGLWLVTGGGPRRGSLRVLTPKKRHDSTNALDAVA